VKFRSFGVKHDEPEAKLKNSVLLLMYNTSMVSFDGGSASKIDYVTALPNRHKMEDMCYYGNVMTTTRW